MKIRNLFVGVLICLLVLLTAVPLSAENTRLYDEAGCLTEEEKQNAEAFLLDISETCDCSFAVVTLRTLNGEDAGAAADRYSDRLLGEGGDKVLLLYAELDSTVAFSLNGRGHAALGGVSEDLLDTFVEVFRRNGFYEATIACLREGSRKFSVGEEEKLPSKGESLSQEKHFLLAGGIGFAVALIITLVMKGKLKTVRPQNSAKLYQIQNSLHFSRHDDIFLYNTVTRVRRQTSSSGSSGGRSSSSGHSTHSRHF